VASALERRVHAALSCGDASGARRLVDELERRGDASERLAVYRALLHIQEGALEPALRSARPLLASADPAVRAEAVRIVSGVAKTLAYRHYTGDGAEWNPFRALEYMREACAAGDAESCRNVDRVTGRVPP
jgi:TPR repeat protein